MKKVLIDTNALMAIAEYELDLFTQLQQTMDIPFKTVILEGTIQELHHIQEQQKNKFKRAAKLVLDIIKAKKITILYHKGLVDDVLARHSAQGDLVLTQDAGLKKRLIRPYLTIRQKKRIMVVG